MANKKITELTPLTLPYVGGEVGVVDDGTTTYRADLRYWGLSNASITYNADGTIDTVARKGRTMTATYSAGALQSLDDGTVTISFVYDGSDQLTTITVGASTGVANVINGTDTVLNGTDTVLNGTDQVIAYA